MATIAVRPPRARRTATGLVTATTILALLAGFAFPAAAEEKERSDGVVVAIRDGELARFQRGRWIPLAVGQKVARADRVRTDRTAVATVTLAGIGRIVIGPSSEIELGKDPRDFRIRMQRGFAWFEASLLRGRRASIVTSLATAGVRGTAFSVCYDGKNYCACTCAGEVDVAPPGGGGLKVPRGEYVAFAAGGPMPGQPAQGAALLERTGAGFDFCFNCHAVGGKGALRQDRK